MIVVVFLVLPLSLYLIWNLKWSVTERFLLTITTVLFECFIIQKWLNFSDLNKAVPYIKILAFIVITLKLVIYIGKKIESIVTIKKLGLGLFFIFLFGIFLNSAEFYNPKFPKEDFVEGYLKKDATWTDEYNDVWHMNKLAKTGRVHGNSELTRIEIWNNTPAKDIIVMIYFLDGRYAGRWGYTIKAYTKKLNESANFNKSAQ